MLTFVQTWCDPNDIVPADVGLVNQTYQNDVVLMCHVRCGPTSVLGSVYPRLEVQLKWKLVYLKRKFFVQDINAKVPKVQDLNSIFSYTLWDHSRCLPEKNKIDNID